jgi:hypothetical protein
MVFCLLLALAGADVVPPDSKAITHRVRFEGLSPDFVFYLYPRDLPRDAPGNSSVRIDAATAELSALNPLAVNQAGGAFLYAVPKSLHAGREAPDEAWFAPGRTPGVRSARLVAPRKYVSASAGFDTLETRYRVQGLPGALDLVPLGEETLAGGVPVRPFGALWLLLGLPVLAAAWIAWRLRSRRARAAP